MFFPPFSSMILKSITSAINSKGLFITLPTGSHFFLLFKSFASESELYCVLTCRSQLENSLISSTPKGSDHLVTK